MRVTDLLQVAEIERKCFLDPWGLHAFVSEFLNRQSERLVVRLAEGDRVVAFGVFWWAADELHINNVAVHPELRGRGLAERLLGEAFCRGRGRGIRQALLEVRPSNQAAIRLYQRLGFEKLGVRRGYYSDNGEDAWVYRRLLEGS